MNRFAAQESESNFFTDIFKIALGVFIGSLLAAFAYTKIVAVIAERELREATAEFNKEANAQAAKMRQQAALQSVEREAKERAQFLEKQRQTRYRQEHEAKMRAAWTSMYQPSAACKLDPTTMPCVNAHAAAHKRFTELYNELPPRF